MKGIRSFVQLMAAICLAGALAAARPLDIGTTITVTTTQDTVVNNGNCSLREAIQAANTNDAVDTCAEGVGSDTIAFAISTGPQTILLGSTIHVTSVLHLDGRTQPGFDPGTAVPIIAIHSVLGDLFSFDAGSTGSSVRGFQLSVNAVAHADEAALHLETNGMHIEGNYINTDGTSNTGGGDALGVLIASGDNNYIGDAGVGDRNLFGGGRFGVVIEDGSNNTIRHNYFGLRADGVTIPSGFGVVAGDGIVLCAGEPAAETCTNTVIRSNTVGGFATGILLGAASSYSTIAGNYIGVGSDGVTDVGDTYGIWMQGSAHNTIGGVVTADRNVISGYNAGIMLEDSYSHAADANVILGNFIGTTADGLNGVVPFNPAGTTPWGLFILSGDGNTVGGTAAGSGNLISGNHTGLRIEPPAINTVVRGNLIGTDVTGASAIQQSTGIYLASVTSANIGDSTTPGGNVISGNDQGIRLIGSSGVTIYGNRVGLTALGNLPLANDIGLSLEGTSSAAIAQNWIANNAPYGVSIGPSSTAEVGSSGNCFTGNSNEAVHNMNTGATAPFAANWWGSATGPTDSGNPGGSGDGVSDYVDYSGWLTTAPPACQRAHSDYDGDGKADVAVFDKAAGNWFVLGSTDGFFSPALNFGGNAADYLPVPGDYDADGSTDAAVFQKATGNWFVIGTTDGFFTPALGFGNFTDFWPVPADYDGDGMTDPAVVHRTNGNWFVVGSTDGFFSPALNFGNTSFIPVPADYDGDGKADAAMYEKATGNWFVVGSTDGFFSPALSFGGTGYMPVPEDYDGDGTADAAVFHETAGNWFVVGSTDGFYSPALNFGGTTATYTPLPADYDGDGKTDPTAFDRAAGNWFVIGSTDGFFMPALNFGGNASVYRPVVGSWWLTELATD